MLINSLGSWDCLRFVGNANLVDGLDAGLRLVESKGAILGDPHVECLVRTIFVSTVYVAGFLMLWDFDLVRSTDGVSYLPTDIGCLMRDLDSDWIMVGVVVSRVDWIVNLDLL